MSVLLVDTAGPVVGVSAWSEGGLVYAAATRRVEGADGWLLPAVAEALGRVGRLDRVAVTVGPGAFTGVRVGVAVALGLACARGVPVVPLSALALRATLVPGRPRVLAWLDARRGCVYAQAFDTRGPVPVALDEAGDLAPAVAAAGAPGVAVGEGAWVYRAVLEAAGHSLAEEPTRSPVSRGLELIRSVTPCSPAEVTIPYLRGAGTGPSPV